MKKRPKKIGRPKGAKNIKAEAVIVAGRCPRCGSSSRGAYTGSTSRTRAEGTIEGKPYNLIVSRRCACVNCGQIRLERTFELIP